MSNRDDRQRRSIEGLKERMANQARIEGKLPNSREIERTVQSDVARVAVDHSKAWNK